ncbi:hypothetical protein G3576_26940 [Roseomonas stagni]|uniref:HdeD family acid-resistance protein n=1 Tax=Falsiroseomonas algicola TaxID=2716930 RepID=A0A6M1LUH6_9PROT|nr:DUF308 domain-containing protein [Falsiroseomonas algicola]NGM23679.1 hypothetical protein [Falsiroseomonas algicola]
MSGSMPEGRFAVVRMLAQGWWLFLLRGVAGILFGLLALVAPGLGLAFVLGFLAAFLLVEGIATLLQAARGTPDPVGNRSRTWLWIDGIASTLAGVGVLVMPGVSAVLLVVMVGAWAAIVGAMRLVMAFRAGDVLMGLLGALAVFVGAWMVVAPGPGMLALVWLVGLQALVTGGLFLAIGWRLRRIAKDPHGPAP